MNELVRTLTFEQVETILIVSELIIGALITLGCVFMVLGIIEEGKEEE